MRHAADLIGNRIIPSGIDMIPIVVYEKGVPGVVHLVADDNATGDAQARRKRIVGVGITLADSCAIHQNVARGIFGVSRIVGAPQNQAVMQDEQLVQIA